MTIYPRPCERKWNKFHIARVLVFFTVVVDSNHIRCRYHIEMITEKETEWVKRLCAAKDLLEWQKLSAELHASSSNEEFRWRILCACLKHFVELETRHLERQVSEYCLVVFDLFEPGLSSAREQNLRDEADRRACVIFAVFSSELWSVSALEREFIELLQNGKIKEDEFVAHISCIKTSRAWALLNFVLYTRLYSMKYGKTTGCGFSIPIGIVVGAVGRFCA